MVLFTNGERAISHRDCSHRRDVELEGGRDNGGREQGEAGEPEHEGEGEHEVVGHVVGEAQAIQTTPAAAATGAARVMLVISVITIARPDTG